MDIPLLMPLRCLLKENIDILRHGEAVGIGMLCEIYYLEGKSKKFLMLKNLLDYYKLPSNLSHLKNH